MSILFVIRQLGKLMMVLSLSLTAMALYSLLTWLSADDPTAAAREHAALMSLLGTIGAGVLLGAVMIFATRRQANDFLGRREALLMVASTWILGAALSALPFFIWAQIEPTVYDQHPFKQYIPCFFEAMSGLTTTGATVLGVDPADPMHLDIENLPRGLLLWRAATHWLGGLGIVVLFVAVLPMVGVGGKKLFQLESSVQSPGGVRPRIAETARVLWIIYLVFTVAQILLLKIFGGPEMDWFNAVCHTFATLATGGFSTSSASAAHFNSAAVDWIIIVFMLLAGVNFGLYYHIARRNLRAVLGDTEFRAYLTIIALSSAVVTWQLWGAKIVTTAGLTIEDAGFIKALRYGVFQVISMQTTTGYCTADFDQWDFVSKAVLLTLMFVGGCAGSTGGGLKVIRFVVVFKVMLAEIERVFRPNVVRTVRVGRTVIDADLRQATLVYLLIAFLIFAVGTILLMLFESQHKGIDFTTAVTTSAATLNNIGPGLLKVGATGNYGWFSQPSLVLLSILMALGRLELYAILVLFLPRFWRGE